MLEVKKDWGMVVLYVALLAFAFGLVWHGDVKWEVATAFLTGGTLLPGFLGRAKPSNSAAKDDAPK